MNQKRDIEIFLNQIKTIHKSYSRINESNGNNFNIFSVLKIETNEVTTHSRFIAELLNPNGSHGFKSKFLELFVNTLGLKNNLDIRNCEVTTEKYIGKVTEISGGSIDIIIKERGSEENLIMIENKINAEEQPNQLLRYHNAYKKGQLLFLTPTGYYSKQKTSKKIPYKCISYESDIIQWLELCKKETVNTPIVRESITIYVNLIKKITNQNINSEMNKEIINLLINDVENFEAYRTLLKSKNDIKDYVIQNKVFPILKKLKIEFDSFEFEEDINKLNKKYATFCSITNDKLREKNLKIVFQFQNNKTNNLIGGFNFLDKELKEKFNYKKLEENFKEKFNNIPCKSNESWIYFDYHYFMNLDSNLLDLKNLIFGEFEEDIKYKINSMLNMIDESF